MAAAASTTATFLTWEVLGAAPGPAALVALLQTFSFSSLVFDSMPESYPLSGAVLAFAWLLGARLLRDGRTRALDWVVAASVALGLTITNLALALMPLVFVDARRRSWRDASRLTLGVGAAAVVLALVQLAALNAAFGEHLPGRRVWRHRDLFLAARPVETAVEFPTALEATLIGWAPARVVTGISARRGYRYKEMFTFNDPELSGWLALRLVILAGALTLGGRRLARSGGGPLVAAALATLAFNACLHAVYRGSDLLLYSRHWLPALMILAGGLALGPRREKRLLAALVAAAVIENLVVLVGIVRVLRAG